MVVDFRDGVFFLVLGCPYRTGVNGADGYGRATGGGEPRDCFGYFRR